MDKQRDSISREPTNAALLGLFVNVSLGIVKLFAGILGRSFALIADSVNSLGDSAASVIVLASLRVAQKPEDSQHPYGHSRAEAVGASTVSLLIIIAALIVGWQALSRITLAHEIPPAWTLWVAGMNVIIKEGLFRYNLRVGKRTKSSAIIANAWDHRADALCSFAVLVGLGVVRWGGQDLIWADETAALVIVIVILVSGFRLYANSASELMDPQAAVDIVERIRASARRVDGVCDVEKLWVRKTGLEYFVDVHIQVDPALSVREGHEIGHKVKDALLNDFNLLRGVLVHLEPFGEFDTP